MKYSSINRGIPVGNPIANVFVILVGALFIGVSIVVGFVAFLVLGSIIAVLAAVVGIRMWWFNRKLGDRASGGPARRDTSSGGVIEGEFHVVEDHRDRDLES